MEYGKLLKGAGLARRGRGFYGLRRTFSTVANNMPRPDRDVVNFAMGHCDESMRALYQQDIFEERIEPVSEYVRDWLFG